MRVEMNAMLLLAALIAVGLLIYLFISLIKPEWFG